MKDWQLIGPPQYLIDRAHDFMDVGVDEFMFHSIANKPELFAELDEQVFSTFD